MTQVQTQSEQSSPQPPLDLSHHYSYTTRHRSASSVKGLYKYYFIPGISNLAGGLPHPSYFPYDTLEATIAIPQRFQCIPKTYQNGGLNTAASSWLRVPRTSPTTNLQKKIDLATALQYGTADGYPALRSFVRKFARENLHPNVAYEGGPEILLTCGSTDGFCKIVEASSNIWDPDRDWIRERQGMLCEEFVYMNPIDTVKPRGLNVVGIATDKQGMLASGKAGLADVLENWDYRKGRLPHLLYTVTIGQNPTGGTLSVERRKEIYALCQKHDILIIEDDPYWNLQYPSAPRLEAHYRNHPVSDPPRNYTAGQKSSGYEFLDSLVPSYLSIDTEGRVIRLDTFSKTIAPGCRLGWVTAQPAIIEKLTRITEATTQQPSGFVQSLVAEMLLGQPAEDSSLKPKKHEQSWQMTGWVRWLEGLRGDYERRMQAMYTILEEGRYLINNNTEPNHGEAWEVIEKIQMFDFVWPTAGMFVWLKVSFETHPYTTPTHLRNYPKHSGYI